MYVEYIDILNKVLDRLISDNANNKSLFTYDKSGMDKFMNKVLEEPNLPDNFKNYTLELNHKFKSLL